MGMFKKLFGGKKQNAKEEGFALQPQNKTAGGSDVYHYKDNEGDFIHPPEVSCVYLDEITTHIEKHIGNPEIVFHEIISDHAHIDVHWVKPSANYPYNVLITSGMSDFAMHMPQGMDAADEWSHAELLVVLPADWKISDEDFKSDDNYWPVYFLKMIARLPHKYKTWLGYGHTIPNGEDAARIANTGFGCMLLIPPFLSFPEDFLQLKTKDGTRINFYSLIPLYKEEMELKLEEGTDALLDRFDDTEISELIDIYRPNVAI